ncbi:hypothetical protein [uncultured Roseobacter sp.]|uniref:hypothetical protein n=1 Tax=uncultured Roseobacter sp. TaxID=114847 RepID=UPI0026336F99|nr:hypothetical protein [uncultured Roseobacter sp.]
MAQTMDRDIAAIRAMIAEESTAPDVPAAKPTSPRRRAQGKRPAQRQFEKPAAPVPAPARKPLLRPVLQSARRRVLSYRPNAKTVLATSLVLLLVLQPVLVLGTLLIAAIGLMITFLILGAETFWRRFLSVFNLYARWFPASARSLRIRSELAARKWDRLLERLPDRLEDCLRAPDLRAMARADKRHAEAVADRLSRLHDEGAV